MKILIQIILSMILAINAVASATTLPNYWIPIHIETYTPQSIHFLIPEVPLGGFKKDQVYFLYDGEKYFSALNRGVDAKGRTLWSNMEPMPTPINGKIDNPGVAEGPLDKTETNGAKDSSRHSGAIGAAIQSGLAHAIYKGIIYTPDYIDKMNRLTNQINDDYTQTHANYTYITETMSGIPEKMNRAILQFRNSLQEQTGLYLNTNITYTSKDLSLVNNLKEVESLLRSVSTTNPIRQEARELGFNMIKQSDQASALGDDESARSFLQFSEAFADITIGLDPLTGPIRDTFEAFTGKNLVTQETLEDYERTFAFLGAITFGFGSKIGKGLKLLNKLSNSPQFLRSLGRAEEVAVHMERKFGGASNRALHEKYLKELRATMERPVTKDERLRKFINDFLWKDSGRIGNGSTAAAIRLERLEGLPVSGRYHSLKGEESIVRLERWLKNNPTADPSDIHAVENIILDLHDALKGTL